MNKRFYLLSFLAFILYLSVTVIQSVTYIIVGPDVFRLEAFTFWFIVGNYMLFTATFLLLQDFRYKGFRFSYLTGWVGLSFNLAAGLVFYLVINGVFDPSFYFPALIVAVLANSVAAASLVFSSAGQERWLKICGVFQLLFFAVIISLIILSAVTENPALRVTLSKIDQWFSLAGAIPLLLLLKYINQQRHKAHIDHTPVLPTTRLALVEYVVFPGFPLVLIAGILIITQGATSLHWKNVNLQAAEELAKKSQHSFYVHNNGDTLHYLLMAPLQQVTGEKYPLVVCLPYGGYQAPAAELLSTETNRTSYPSYLFVPYCKAGYGWGGIDRYPARDELVYAALESLQNAAVDWDRVYVSGVSLGGYGSWHFITEHPELFAAAIPVCGGGNPEAASHIKDVAVWAFHGGEDKNVPVSESRNMVKALQDAGVVTKYTEFPNKAHSIWWEVTQTPGLLNWLFSQHKTGITSGGKQEEKSEKENHDQ